MTLTLTILAATAIASAASAQSSPALAVIVNLGSTDIAGYRISVERQGKAEYAATPRRPNLEAPVAPIHRTLPDALVERFFADLEGARPLVALPRAHCLKSASLGTRTMIEFGNEKTPDLSCPNAQNEHVKSLMRDVTEIVNAFRSDWN